MSYCRFQNTDQDLRECANVLEETETVEDLDLSSDEMCALKRMRDLCEMFLERCE
jgi:hypothetical protein